MENKQEDYAGRVFLLMGKEYRISRSIRAQWFFQHINSIVYPKRDQELISSHEELEVLSVLPEVSHIHSTQSFRLEPSTRITFIGRQYRFIFCLDISPSEATVNAETGKMLSEEIFENFMNCIMGLVEPFTVPGSNLVLQPELVITVLAHMPLAYKTCQVLVQGLNVCQSNLYDLLYEVKSKLQTLEDILAHELIKKYEKRYSSEAESCETDDVIHDAESSLFNMVRDALLALQLLPDNASAGLVIVTDGVFNLSDASVVDAVLAQMRASTVVCSFLQVGSAAPNGLGYIPHTALMQFIASATSGAYMCSCPKVSTADPKQDSPPNEIQDAQPMNIYHEALLCWNFHTGADRSKIEFGNAVDELWLNKVPSVKAKKGSVLPQPMQKIKHSETKHATRIASVLSVRLREGYSIENVAITKDGTQLEVKLTLPWKEHVLIEYIAKAAWPLEQVSRSTHVDVCIEGSYDFLVDITSKQKFTSSYRKTVVYKFQQTMKSLQATDELLVRLQSFSVNPAYTTIPDSAKDGVPLFHLPQSSTTPVLSLQHGRSKKSSKSQEALFAEYWKPILHLDTKTWQKWFHCHRVSILLENDRPISKSLFIPSSSDHFHTVHCRTAMNALNRMLRDWSSFVLLENHSYIRFLGGGGQKMPYSFCLLRLVFKGLCVVVRLAFLGGTAGTERHRMVSELKESLKSIKAPLKKPLFSPEHTLSAESPPKSVVLTTKEKRCVIFLEKPLERILVKYDSIPEDLKSIEIRPLEGEDILDITQSSNRLTTHGISVGSNPGGSNAILGALSRYMYNQRWIWKMSCQAKDLHTGAVAGVLYALTKRRLMEGFHFCSSNQNGVITMVKEIPVTLKDCASSATNNVCVLQFVLFPPHRCVQLRDGVQDESVESDAVRDSKGELQIATEIWIEPQCGVVSDNEKDLKYVEGMEYFEIPGKMFSNDLQAVKEMVTYAHLESMCIDSILTTVPAATLSDIEPSSDCFTNSSVIEVPFLFDVVSLLSKSKQVLMLLPLLKNSENDVLMDDQCPNDILISLFFNSMTELVDCEVPFSAEACKTFSAFVQERCAQTSGDEPVISHAIQFDTEKDPVTWKCYAGASRRSIIILMIPASLSDVEKIRLPKADEGSADDDEKKEVDSVEISKDDSVVDDQEHEPESIRESTKEITKSPSVSKDSNVKEGDVGKQETFAKKARPFLPIFIYECKFAAISDMTSVSTNEQNLFVDYTSKLSDSSIHGDQNTAGNSNGFLDQLGKSCEFSAFCKSLSDRFFLTFVNGVFTSLQKGFVLNSKDVESSVELICEESCLEVDITSFIRIICMHFKNEKIDDEVFGHISEGNVVIRRAGKISSGSTSKSTPRTPSCVKTKCGSEAIHRFVQHSFLEILQNRFTSVPQNDELFYFNANEAEPIERDDHSISEAESDTEEPELQVVNMYGSSENLPVTNEDITEANTERDEDVSNLSRLSTKGSSTSLSEIESMDVLSEAASLLHNEGDDPSSQHPLFLHLMCTLRDRNLAGSDLALVPVNTLPTCLAEIISMLENGGNSIDPFSPSLKVTLDLICLTLPPEMESSKNWKIVDDATSTHAASEMDEDFLFDEHGSIAEDQLKQGVFEMSDEKEIVPANQREKASTLIDNALTDPLKTLPKAQLNAFKVIVKKIEWLLRDEIASALRSASPVTEATLDNVADHVKSSNASNCQFRRISLRFVSGLDKSLQLFLDELSRAEINDYHLENKGKYFYFVPNQTTGANGTAVEKSETDIQERKDSKSDGLSRKESVVNDTNRSMNQEPTESRANEDATEQETVLDEDVALEILPNELETKAKAQDATKDISSVLSLKQPSDYVEGVEDDRSIDEGHCPSLEQAAIREQVQETQDEMEESIFAICQEIVLKTLDIALQNSSNETNISDISPRSRSESLPPPLMEAKQIVRRRYSDPGTSCVKRKEMSLNLDDSSAEYRGFSFQECITPREKYNPGFWLFARVQGSEVMVFLHKRREAAGSGDVQSEKCYIDLLGIIDKIGRVVNQKMLLDDLHETFTCHNLLVAEEDDQVWSRRESSPGKTLFVSSKSEMGMPFEIVKVVHGEFEFHPGFFECDKVWETFLQVHYRLKSSPGQPKGTSRAMQAVRAVLERFAVSNRSNLFVYRESSGDVFYFRIHETLSEVEPPSFTNMLRQGEEDPLKEDNFSYHSAASSSWSLAGKLHQEAAQEAPEESEIKEVDLRLRRTNSLLTHTEKDSVSELSFASVMSVQRIQFCVHGICEPGSEIKDELVRVLAKKLNDAVFEQLNLLIARNPKCRLAPADVQFIQPPGQSPATVIRISMPRFALPYAHSLIFYLRQNLLLRFHTPRYTEASPDFHFKNYNGHASSFASAEPLPLNDVYLYNRREKKGYGIGCIHMTLTDCDQKPIIAYPIQQKVRTEIWESEIYLQTLREFIDVRVVNETKEIQVEEEMFLEFKVWERGSIGIEELQSFLVSDIRRALCDVFLEYFILFTPISEIPANLQMHYHSRASSRNSQPTTPTFVKTDPTTPVSSTPFPRQLGKKFLSEPATPAELRARSPANLLRKRSLIELPVKESLSRKSSKESPREVPKKSHQEIVENIEKTYETLEEFFPLNPTDNPSRESPVPKRSDSEEASRKDSVSNSSDVQSGSVSDVERMLPKISGMENSLGSPYDTLTDREVEESFNATNEPDDRGREKKEPTWKDVEWRRRRDRESRMARRRYERGEIGFLHPCYCDGIDAVLKEIMEEGSYSVHKHNGSLDFKYATELVLKEVLKILVDVAPNIKPKVFKESTASLLLESEESEALVYSPYHFERSAVKSDDMSETSTDVSNSLHPASILPGFKSSFIAVGRNMKQWRQCVSINEAVSDEEEKATYNTGFSKQHFKPLMPENSTNYPTSRSADTVAPSCIKMAFVPRQKFYLVRFMDKEIVTYTYNFPMEVNVLLDKQLGRLYGWHNARMHLASCLSIQKLGLFHHLHFIEEKQSNEETASFCSSTSHSHVTGLLKETVPPPREKNKAATSDLSKTLGLQMPTLDETFRNTAPLQPLNKASYRYSNDPMKRIGYQYQEITRTKINVASQQAKLKEILETWHNLGPHYPLFENRLSLLKRHSRFIHFCQTPLLFNPSKTTAEEHRTDPNAPEKIQEQCDKASSESKQNGKEEAPVFVEEKHDWYGELKWVVMQKYIQYLQTLGFCVVQLQPNAKGQQSKSSKASMKRSSSKNLPEPATRSRPSVHYLQKSTNAGILLLELSYRNDNLFLKMFAFDASRVKSLDRYITMHEHWMFQDDCNKYKDLLHLHSFAYDLQLRQAQQFLSGRNMIFYPGYPVQKLLERMISVFPRPPAFSFCYLAQGTVSIPCTAELDTKEVYKYLSINAERYILDPAKITKIDDSAMKDDQSSDQSILSYMYYTSRSQDKGEFQKLNSGFRRDSADFDGNVIITLSPSQDKEVLNLTFFLVLTNRREFYPRRSLKSQMSSLRSKRKRTFSGSEKSSAISDESQLTGPHKLRVRFSTDNSSNSLTEDNEQVQTGPLKVPTWPGTLNPTDSSSPTNLSSPSSDTILLIAKKNQCYTNFDASRLSQSPSAEMFIRRSSSNDSISSSVLTNTNIKKSLSSGQLGESAEVTDVNFLANEVAFVSGRVSKIACTCLSNCWRDFMWCQLLIMESSEDDASVKRQKKKVEVRKESIQDVLSQNWKLTRTLKKIRQEILPSISVSEVKMLLELVKVYPLSEIDKRMEIVYTLLGNTKGQKHGTMRVLSGKFGKAYREFTTDDSRTRYICVLNPRDLDMFVMVTTDSDGMIRDIKAVYREEPRFQPSAVARFGNLKENDRADVEHIESVLSCLSYNIWTELLPSQ